MKNKSLIAFLLIIFGSALVYQQWSQLQATNEDQSSTSATLDYTITGASESQWIAFGRETAVLRGMVGASTTESWALMRFGSYLTLTDSADTRLTRDHPVFVYQAVGSIPNLKGFGSASGRQDITGLFSCLMRSPVRF